MKKYFSILLLWVLSSCLGNGEQVPGDILPKETMVRILIDIHMTEAQVKQRALASDSATTMFQQLKKGIIKKNHTTPEVFKKSYDYYMSNLKGMDDIYAAIVDSLSFREARGKLD